MHALTLVALLAFVGHVALPFEHLTLAS